MDRMRESMFSILGPLEGLSFLDLFAGSGVIALEAVSRGARKVLLVEKDPKKRRVVMENLAIATGADIRLLIRPVERVLKPTLESFDIVHLDPPFPMRNKERWLAMADSAGQPISGGVLMIHYPSEDDLPESVGGLRRTDLRQYGRSLLGFYTRTTPGDNPS